MSADKALHYNHATEKGEWPDWDPPEPPTFAIREEWTAPQRALKRLGRYLRTKLPRRPARTDETPHDDPRG